MIQLMPRQSMHQSTPATVPVEKYNDERFWEKVGRFAKRAGRELIEKVLWLHYAAQNDKTPLWAKTTIYGALAYFILPADAIPDFLPAAGLTDDLGAIVAALATVSMYVTPEVKQKTNQQLTRWFGDQIESPASKTA